MKNSFDKISINKVKNYWDERPCNIRHSTKEMGTKEYFEDVERRKYFVEPHIPKFAEFKKWKGKRVLEIGCGIGTDTINFIRAGAEITAVELSEKSLEIAKKRAEVFNLSNKVKFYRVNAEELSKVVPIESYDLIYSFGVIHHTPHPERVINEIYKYSKKGTIVKIMVYYRYSWKVFWILIRYSKGAFWKIKELIAKNSEAQTGCPITYTYSKKEVAALLKGFKAVNISIDHIFPYKINDYIKYQYNVVWYFRRLPKFIFRWLEKKIGWHLLITAVKE